MMPTLLRAKRGQRRHRFSGVQRQAHTAAGHLAGECERLAAAADQAQRQLEGI
ncbi:hypothetical protein [Salinicola tamaricis]|uniref:hypothetical protein n=1 Tax=Salinicola tamaricis TaxID=1771309 RepID=UPI0013EB1A29|nr:hypothetical protein [Salinicola tamaricis]